MNDDRRFDPTRGNPARERYERKISERAVDFYSRNPIPQKPASSRDLWTAVGLLVGITGLGFAILFALLVLLS